VRFTTIGVAVLLACASPTAAEEIPAPVLDKLNLIEAYLVALLGVRQMDYLCMKSALEVYEACSGEEAGLPTGTASPDCARTATDWRAECVAEFVNPQKQAVGDLLPARREADGLVVEPSE
jgi:hypothetical protein